MENFWCAARLMPRREGYATHFLQLAGFTTYLPRLRENHTVRGRKVDPARRFSPATLSFFSRCNGMPPRWSPGVAPLDHGWHRPPRECLMVSSMKSAPASVTALSSFPRRPGLRRRGQGPGHPRAVRGSSGALCRPGIHDRVAVLLQFLGGRQRTELPADAIEAVGARS